METDEHSDEYGGLPSRPVQNRDAALVIQKTDKNHVLVIRRRTTAELLRDLNSTLQDAGREIGLGPYALKADAIGFRSMPWPGRVAGLPPQDLSHYMMDVKRRYTRWRTHMLARSLMSMSICQRVWQDDETIDAVRRQERIRRANAIQLLQWGLNEYSILAGWGDQIGP